MCVIIAREPKIELPFDKMVSACHVNADGFGLSVVDRGKIETIKEYNPKGNDPEAVMKRLEDAKEQKVYLHLRFKTAGGISEEACHPFDTFTTEDHKFHIQFMHNGTLYEFSDNKSKLPDSYHFNMQIVRPLLERFRQACTSDDQILKDPFVETILSKWAGTGSIFTLFDQNGNEMIINKKQGKEFDGWWASNEYSFNRYHREKSTNGYSYDKGKWFEDNYDDNGYYIGGRRSDTSTYYVSGKSKEGDNVTPFQADKPASSTASAASGSTGGGKSSHQQAHDRLREHGAAVGQGIKDTNIVQRHLVPIITPPEKRETFCELAGLTSLEEVAGLEYEDVLQLVENYAEMAALLIMDLNYELYLRNSSNKKVS